jgi:hypothetical protein
MTDTRRQGGGSILEVMDDGEQPARGLGSDPGYVDAADHPSESDFWALVIDPILLALVFAMVSWPVVALSLARPSEGGPGLWVGTLGAVAAAALVASTIGAPLVRANALRGSLWTILIAWVVAIATLPMLPIVLGWNDAGSLGFGQVCIDGCMPAITTESMTSGLAEIPWCWLSPLVAPVSFGVLVLGVALWTNLVRSWDKDRPVAG